MNETSQDMKKIIIYILILAGITFVVGLILYLSGLNVWFNYFFYDNAIMYSLFSLITQLGETRIFIFLIVIVWYAYDKGFAKNLAYTVLGSGYVNNIAKDIFRDPRPPTNLRPLVTGDPVAEGFGFPSGHSQLSVSSYGYLAYEAYVKKSKIIFWIFTVLVYLIASSRIIIGVHDLQDVWGGLTIGFIWIILFILLEPKVSKIISSYPLFVKLIWAVVLPIVLFVIGIFAFPDPTGDYGLIGGGMMGLAIGYLLESEYIKYDPRELKNIQRILNLVIGIVITLVLYLLLSFVFPESQIMDFVQYLILSFLLVTVVPWLFTKINRK
ncbi:MAG: phosphatase PAP2 family protein [Candidatus Hermodarchaeota archaeon]